MVDNFIYKGLWFLPEKPENELHGTLKFDVQDGIELELLGELEGFKYGDYIHDPDIICGFTTTGKKITLYKCFQFHSTTSLPGIPSCKYSASFIFIGEYFYTKSDLVFNNVEAEIDKLSQWLNKYGFEKVESDFELKKTEIEYKLPASIDFKITNDKRGTFDFSYTVPFSRNTNRINLEQKVNLDLSFTQSVHFDDLISEYFHFQNFMILGLYSLTHPISLTLKAENLKREIGKKEIPIDIQVHFRPNINSKPNKKKSPRDFLFSYKDIDVDFERLIQNWFVKKIQLKPIISMIIESFNDKAPFTENSFLNIVQGLETYHRRFKKNNVQPKTEHKEKLKEILESVNPKHKEWLSSKLHFSNEPTLHKRLQELLNENYNPTLSKMISDREQFIKDVKNSRNYYTHYDKSLERKAIKGNELYYLTEKLKILLICVLLNEIGINNEKITQLLSRNEWRFFNHLID